MIFCVKKKSVVIAIVALLIVVLLTAGLVIGLTNNETMAQAKLLPIYSVETSKKVVALTFDAAWGADKTQGIMNILKEYNATATFFLVGFWVNKYEAEVRSIDQAGFEIGNHSHNHLKMSTITETEIATELNYVSKNVKRITGKDCKVFRPPFGDYNNRLISGVEAAGMKTIQWDVDSLDWKGISADEIMNRIKVRVKNGSIILFHNNSEHVLDALPQVLLYLKNEGYSFSTVSDMIYHDNYSIDNNGRQHLNK